MAGIKYQYNFNFPNGFVYVLLDDEWGIEIKGESGYHGELVTLGSWDFSNRVAWFEWGATCTEQIQYLKNQFDQGVISEDDVLNKVDQLDCLMGPTIKESLTSEPILITEIAN
ncbi:hypothetical protein [Cytobacillus gottheilii]|uniref:hypothetical protein n=1 Tax=Cytobacillus gottheilii TaxID=859144 RepID=UPI002494EB06|nr:hypothetical protein [Cytobacillus gottheilii]